MECCRNGSEDGASEKTDCCNAEVIYRLKQNWFYILLASCLLAISNSSPLGTLHEFLTNPTALEMEEMAVFPMEPGLGQTEHVYTWSVTFNSIGSICGGLLGGVLASTIPYWHSFLQALLFNAVGFLIYATAMHGWVVVVARFFVGVASGLQQALVYAYIAVSYQDYVEVRSLAGKKAEFKYCRVKDILFSVYTIATKGGYFLGSSFSVLLAQFTSVNHFRAVGWYNFGLAVLVILLQFVLFHGESKCQFINVKQLLRHCKFTGSKTSMCCTLVILGFLLLCTGVIKSRTAFYELLFEPVLADSFGFSQRFTIYYFQLILVVPIFGGLLLLLLEWSRLSNLLISILGIMASIVGLLVMCDWQTIPYDPCLKYSLYPNYSESAYELGIQVFSPQCWHLPPGRERLRGISNLQMTDRHVELFLNPHLEDNGTEFSCSLHPSDDECHVCQNTTSMLELNFETAGREICYTMTMSPEQEKYAKFSIVCDALYSDNCVSACLNIPRHRAKMKALEEDAKQLFRHAYKQSIVLVENYAYEAARNRCELNMEEGCHWIPDSLVTHEQCADCIPLCRARSRTLSFAQFVVGSAWFMLTYPMAEVALPVVLSDSVNKEFQGIFMGLTVAMTELFHAITPLWLVATYESAGQRTFLPLLILIATFLPFLFGLMILYRKLVQLREARHEHDTPECDTGEEIYDLVNQPNRTSVGSEE